MRFAAPELLWLLLLVPVLGLLGWWVHARRARALGRFAGGRHHAARFTVRVSDNRRAIKMLLVAVALAAIPVALARPQWGTRLEPITRRGADVMLLLDTSLSMAAEDLAPNRLGQARHAVGSLLDRLSGDRVGLVTFAGQAQLSCPLTVDHAAVRMFLDSLDVESVPVPGTALAEALELAASALRFDGNELDDRGRAIVLFSDGEDHEGGLDELLDDFEGLGIQVFTLGCGSTRGAPIPLRDSTGMLTGYKKNRDDQVVTTRLDESVLERIALDTGGRYYRSTTGEVEIEEIAKALASLSQGELGSELRTRYEERFQVPLLIGWLALVAETLLGDRRRSARDRTGQGAD